MYKIYNNQIKINQFLKGGSKLKSIETNAYINNNFFSLINLIDDIDFNLVKPFFDVPIVFDNFDFKMLNAIIKTLNMFKFYKNFIDDLKSKELFIKNLKKKIYNERDNDTKKKLQNNLEEILEDKNFFFEYIEKNGNIFQKNLLRFERNIKESKKKLLQITIGNFKELGLFDHYENKFINFDTFVDNIISKENLSKITYDQKNPVSIFLILLLFKKNIPFSESQDESNTSQEEEGEGKEEREIDDKKKERKKDADQKESDVSQEINKINEKEKINPTIIDVRKGNKIKFNDGINNPRAKNDTEIKFISDAKNNINKANVNKQLINLQNYDPKKFSYIYPIKMDGYQPPFIKNQKGYTIYNPNNYYLKMANFNQFRELNPNIITKPIIQGSLLSEQKGGGYKPIIEDDYNNDLLEYYKKNFFYKLEEYYEDFKIIYDEYKDDIDCNKIYFRQTFKKSQYFSVNKRFLSMQGGNYDQLQYNLDGGSLNTIVRIPNLSSYFKSQLKFIENKLRANNKTLSENSRRDINQIIDSLDKHENNLKNNFELLKSAYLINEGTVNLKQHKSQIIEAKKSLSKHKRYAGTFGDLINTLEKIANNYKNKGKKPLDKFFQKQ
jgi:hypothetical protein